jgi:hypothetical protein
MEHIKELFSKIPTRLSANSRRMTGAFWYKKTLPKPQREDGKGYIYPGVIVVAEFWKHW